MLSSPPGEKAWISWSFVAVWSLVIFVTIPLARTLQEAIEESLGRAAFGYSVIVIVVLSLLAAVAYLVRVRAPVRSSYVWVALIGAFFVAYTIELSRGAPEEALHFVQYGLLGILTYRALSHRVRDVGIYFGAAIICGIVGMIDEAIQWLTPKRYWGLRDIWLNFLSAALVQLAIAKGMRPSLISEPLGARRAQRLCRLSALAALVLGASLLNTPTRIAWYADRIPGLAFLKTNESMMVEYGHLYEDPEIGRFYSRLSPEELRRADAERGVEVAEIFDRYPHGPEPYRAFLEAYPPIVDPFAHEGRVHLFSRDYWLIQAEKEEGSEEDRRKKLTVAYRENRILEKYFSRSLASSTYVLDGEKLALMKRVQSTDYVHDSRVSHTLFTHISEAQVAGALALVLLALFLGDRFCGWRLRYGRRS
jgi:hypothetical protein